MNLIDIVFTDRPFYGARRIKKDIFRKNKLTVSRPKVSELMRVMGIQAIYPKPKFNLSKKNKEHKIYPYLLNNLEIKKSNQVWGTDITYIRLTHGFCYLIAILDWFSRYVVGWQVSNNLENIFCVEALKNSLNKHSSPNILNTDQGSQFTSLDFIDVLKQNDVKISMDGKGRFWDNIFTERLWRSVKQENVYINDYQTVWDAKNGINDYFEFYNNDRPHTAFNLDFTPAEIYFKNLN